MALAGADAAGDTSIRTKKKKNDDAVRQRKPKKTIETNIKNITTNDTEMNLEVLVILISCSIDIVYWKFLTRFHRQDGHLLSEDQTGF